MLYAYGVVRTDAEPAVAGVRVLPLGDIGVAVADVSEAPAPAARQLAEHHRVTLALAQAGGVAPFRFGTVFASEEELRRSLEPRMAALASTLREVAGCLELTVTLPAGAPVPDASSPGTAYMLEKKRLLDMEDAARDTADSLRQRLGGTVRTSRADGVRDDVARVVLLVPCDVVGEVRERVLQLEATAQVSGPWAPSSFV